jgi:hypothetical protein
MSARHECSACGITPMDLPDGVGFEDENVLADFFGLASNIAREAGRA